MKIEHRIASKLTEERARMQNLVKEHGKFSIAEVTVEQVYGGIRGVPIHVTDVSHVDPQEGLRLRGYAVPEALEKLPKSEHGEYPLAGGLYYLLMTGEIPTKQEANQVEIEWKVRSNVPEHVFKSLQPMPAYTHPMTLFSQAILALQSESVFAKRFYYGIDKEDYWGYYLEDSLNLTAKLPTIIANIYNLKYRNGIFVQPNPKLDWSANFAYMIGKHDPAYMDLMRLFVVLHSDHEGANVSAHASHLVASALSDIYLSCSSGMNGLAGPLHGLANQECLRWLLDVQSHFKVVPTEEQLRQYLVEFLASGRMIPGYGHAVLRVTDPRFTAQRDFACKFLPDDPLFQLVDMVYQILPGILSQNGKVKNPWPNVDAINGTLQYHFGVTEADFYTVLFGFSRILGISTHVVWSRAMGKPLERPKSLTTDILESMIKSV
ncbi:MAG: type I citrate synthase [Anaerolinea sp.]|nr:type I citrate synthase [Anaerolinea sp.]